MIKSIIISAFYFLLFNCSFGQTLADNDLNKEVDSLVSPQFKQNEPGVSILIARKGNIVYQKAFGSANVELNVSMQPDMVFRIGSITKQFTAISILLLVEQRKISLQDSIQKYIPGFPSKGYTITIENLLTHTSGITDYSSLNDTTPYIDRWDFTPQFILDKFKNLPLDFKPGTKYGYSNSNYLLLGLVIESITKKSYHTYIQENIIEPLGLSHTLYATENTIVAERVEGYTRDRGFFENCFYQSLSFGYACGDLLSSTEDLFKWNTALLAYKLVKKETLDEAFTPYKLSDGTFTKYGYGWFIDDLQGVKCIHHEGQTSGFIAEEKYFPNEDIYVAIMTNVKSTEDTTDFSNNRFKLFENISLLAIGKQLQRSITVSDTILNSYVGVYQLSTDKKRTITISKGKYHLNALISGQGRVPILFESDTKFSFDGIMNATGEFVKENGKTIKINIFQNGQYVWNKIN
jgi:CubicO group peptidase (beta-lactamase class C family)